MEQFDSDAIHAAAKVSQAEADRMRGDKIREELYGVKYATPPSITVGTQVRLTGVVVNVDIQGYVDIHLDGDGGRETSITPEAAKYIEIIRQPFKRGEVVWFTGPLMANGDDGSRVVVRDEANGKVLVVAPFDDATACLNPATDYERRP